MAPARAAVSPTRRARSRWDPATPSTSSTPASTTPTLSPTPACCCPPPWAQRLGIEQAADQLIDLGERPDAHRPGRKLLTLIHAMLAGADCIDDTDLLRCGQTATVLGHRVMAPSTLGTFLRAFTFGHTRQLDRLAEDQEKLARLDH
jgi:hypothetical protein